MEKIALFYSPPSQQQLTMAMHISGVLLQFVWWEGCCWWDCKNLQEEWRGGVRTQCWGGSLYIGKESVNIWTTCNWRQTKFQPQLSPLTHYTPKYFSPRISTQIFSNQGLSLKDQSSSWVQDQCFILMRQPQLGDKTLSLVLISEKCKKGILSVSHFITSYILLKCEMAPTINYETVGWKLNFCLISSAASYIESFIKMTYFLVNFQWLMAGVMNAFVRIVSTPSELSQKTLIHREAGQEGAENESKSLNGSPHYPRIILKAKSHVFEQ